MISELKNSLKKASNDSARCVILTHESHVFSAGHDLKELKSFSKSETKHLFRECADLSLTIRNASFPVIAKLNGLATAVSDYERWFDCIKKNKNFTPKKKIKFRLVLKLFHHVI